MKVVGLRIAPTGATIGFNGDVSAITKANLNAGSMVDGEGGSIMYAGVKSSATSTAKIKTTSPV